MANFSFIRGQVLQVLLTPPHKTVIVLMILICPKKDKKAWQAGGICCSFQMYNQLKGKSLTWLT